MADESKQQGIIGKVLIVGVLIAAVAGALYLKGQESPIRDNPAPSAPETAVPETISDETAADATAPKALPRMVDLGSSTCIPCKMMAPILDELRKEYAGQFDLEFIDVKKDPEVGKPYGVKMIPTQVFFNAAGKEQFRHVGYFSKLEILATWKGLGVKLTPPKEEEE